MPCRLEDFIGKRLIVHCARERYRAALDGLTARWRDAVVRRGGRFLRVTTNEPIGASVRALLEALR